MNDNQTENSKFEAAFKKALYVFKDDMDHALSWLNSPCPALGDQIPIHLLDSTDDLKLVMDELERLEQK
jgi:putative toxin-antitoxin system antitoxin component (TIGR02293 family)